MHVQAAVTPASSYLMLRGPAYHLAMHASISPPQGALHNQPHRMQVAHFREKWRGEFEKRRKLHNMVGGAGTAGPPPGTQTPFNTHSHTNLNPAGAVHDPGPKRRERSPP